MSTHTAVVFPSLGAKLQEQVYHYINVIIFIVFLVHLFY
jgi:hypothetical protein